MGLHPTPLPASSPLDRISLFKRKLIVAEDESCPNKKVCFEVDTQCYSNQNENNQELTPPDSPEENVVEEEEKSEENKENQEKKQPGEQQLDSILAKTLLSKDGGEEKVSPVVPVKTTASVENEKLVSPKVIVEHQPLPSIYEIQQNNNTATEDDKEEFDSGLSDDEETSEDDSDDEPVPSPLYNSVLRPDSAKGPAGGGGAHPPKPIYNDRFWGSGGAGGNANNVFPGQNAGGNNAFQFLEQPNQRIECAENGKSYLQLGTMSHHHHIPVTPVIQPKPNMVYRRPIPPFRNPMMAVQPARPVCDHSNCLQRKSSHCYKNQRSRMLNLSLHKLHMARQNHEGCLRRSVLICNMLRHIEDETEKEAIQESQHYLGETSPPHNLEMDQQYWSPPALPGAPPPVTNSQDVVPPNTLTPSQYHLATGCVPPPSPAPVSAPVVSSSPSNTYNDTYESTLKDFNSAFRVSTPFSSPAPHDMDSAVGEDEGDDRGINWGSVLSLSNQSELDPLNNNTFASETWNPPLSSSSSSSSCVTPLPSMTTPSSSGQMTMLTTTTLTAAPISSGGSIVGDHSSPGGGQSFDDIGWKLSADDVLRAFPNDEHIFVGP